MVFGKKIFIWFIIITGLVTKGVSNNNTLILNPYKSYEISSFLTYHIDTLKTLNPESFITGKCTLEKYNSNNLSYKNGTDIWLAFNVINRSKADAEWLFNIGKASDIEVYVYSNDSLVELIQSGFLMKASKHKVAQNYGYSSVVKLQLVYNKPYKIYVKMRNTCQQF
jgi:hypothetical protein